MTQVCSSCNAQNRDVAKFCDQCGLPLTPDAVAARAAVAPVKQPVNWTPILFIAAIVLGFVWLLKPPAASQQAATAQGANPGAVMEDVQKQLQELKERAEKDPADVGPIVEMYPMYSQIGQVEKVRPYVQKSVDAIVERAEELGSDKAVGLLADLAQAAAVAEDVEGSIIALKGLHAIKPEDHKVLWFIGNLYFDLERAAESIEWYDKYLAQADPATDGDYWNARVDRNTMLLTLSDAKKDPKLVEEAIGNLRTITVEQPAMWAAWFNLGQAYQKHGDAAQAAEAFRKSKTVATDDLLSWRSDEALAILEGREAPPMPNPHGEGMAMEGMSNPHGEGMITTEGVPNPHGEGFGAMEAPAAPSTDEAVPGTTP
jgi:tetratricopeptide (TPR) repeat protein